MTAFELAQRYIGIRELGPQDHPLILWWLSLCHLPESMAHDETPWCGAFLNGIAWELRLPRSKSAAARSWLEVGWPIPLLEARPAYDVVILSREGGGHVGFFAGLEDGRLMILGGNQQNAVSIAGFDAARLLGVRRLIAPA